MGDALLVGGLLNVPGRGRCFTWSNKPTEPIEPTAHTTTSARSTLVIQTKVPIKAEVLELYVRRQTADGYGVQRVEGWNAIKTALA